MRFRVAARQHLGHELGIVGRLVAGMSLPKRVPVLGKDLLEDVPVPYRGGQHLEAPSSRKFAVYGALLLPHPRYVVYPSEEP
jgi:hypothetical protein